MRKYTKGRLTTLENFALVIDGTPQVNHLAVQLHHQAQPRDARARADRDRSGTLAKAEVAADRPLDAGLDLDV
jgi:hypothetical protein